MANRITELTEASTALGDELLEVSQLSTTTRIAAITISAAASDNSFNDSGSGLIAAGFVVGDRVGVSGFTTAANNLLVGVIATLTAGKMTIEAPEGDAIVDEVAGDSVVIAKWNSRRLTTRAQLEIGTRIITKSGTSENLENDDKGAFQRFTNASTKTLTVRPNSTEAIDDEAEFMLRNIGAGALTIVAGSGVTINPPADGSLVLLQGMAALLKRVATDEFDLIGHTDFST